MARCFFAAYPILFLYVHDQCEHLSVPRFGKKTLDGYRDLVNKMFTCELSQVRSFRLDPAIRGRFGLRRALSLDSAAWPWRVMSGRRIR